jgi:hypothetical protein
MRLTVNKIHEPVKNGKNAHGFYKRLYPVKDCIILTLLSASQQADHRVRINRHAGASRFLASGQQ